MKDSKLGKIFNFLNKGPASYSPQAKSCLPAYFCLASQLKTFLYDFFNQKKDNILWLM